MSQSVAEQLRVFRASATEQDASQQSSVPIPPTLRFEDEGFRDLLGDGLVPGTLTEVAGEA